MEDTTKVFQYLCETENVAEEILASRQQITILENQRNKLREASRGLVGAPSDKVGEEKATKAWICFENTFIKMQNDEVQKILKKDQETLAKEIESQRASLHTNVSKLRDIEGQPELTGFQLKSFNENK